MSLMFILLLILAASHLTRVRSESHVVVPLILRANKNVTVEDETVISKCMMSSYNMLYYNGTGFHMDGAHIVGMTRDVPNRRRLSNRHLQLGRTDNDYQLLFLEILASCQICSYLGQDDNHLLRYNIRFGSILANAQGSGSIHAFDSLPAYGRNPESPPPVEIGDQDRDQVAVENIGHSQNQDLDFQLVGATQYPLWASHFCSCLDEFSHKFQDCHIGRVIDPSDLDINVKINGETKANGYLGLKSCLTSPLFWGITVVMMFSLLFVSRIQRCDTHKATLGSYGGGRRYLQSLVKPTNDNQGDGCSEGPKDSQDIEVTAGSEVMLE